VRLGGSPGGGTSRSRGDRGTALVEVTWLAILLLVPLLYIVLAVFEVQRSAFAVSAAARSAGRAYVMAPDEASALERARAAAIVSLADQDLDLRRGGLVVTCDPDPANCLAPGSVVDVDVNYPVTLPLMPAALGGNTPSVRVEARHRLPYGTFREDRP
jgi:Flp pilus assembly protein TadG